MKDLLQIMIKHRSLCDCHLRTFASVLYRNGMLSLSNALRVEDHLKEIQAENWSDLEESLTRLDFDNA